MSDPEDTREETIREIAKLICSGLGWSEDSEFTTFDGEGRTLRTTTHLERCMGPAQLVYAAFVEGRTKPPGP